MIAGKVNNGPVVVGAPAEAHIVAGSVKKIELTGTVEKSHDLAGTVAPEKTLQGAVFVGGGGAGGDLSEIEVWSQANDYDVGPAPGDYGIGRVHVKGDQDLVPENIKDGVNILGVQGTYKAPEPPPPENVKLTTRKVTIKENGTHTISTPAGYTGMTQVTAVVDVPVNVTEETVDANFQEKTVTPTAGGHIVEPDEEEGFNALSRVVVTGDAALKPDNIRKGATIFGVAGAYEKTEVLDAVMQTKSVTPTAGGFTVKPDEGVDGLSSVTVAGDGDLIPANVREGVEIFGVKGSYSTGQKYQTKNVTPTAGGVSVTADSGYNALAQVNVAKEPNLVPGNIAPGVSIFGVAGAYKPPMKTVEVQSGPEDGQTILPTDDYVGFSAVVVKPYDPTPHYNEGYDAGHEAGHAVGYDDGYREACQAHGIAPLYCLYNGVRLPAPPKWDKGTHPHAYVVKHSGLLSSGYDFIVSSAPLYVCQSYPSLYQWGECVSTRLRCKTNGISPDDYAWVNPSSGEEGVWGTPHDSEEGGAMTWGNALIWANCDVNECVTFGKPLETIGLYASEPVPIYK